MDREKKRTVVSGLLVTTLLGLCCALGALQYTWNAEVSAALRDRLRSSLQASLVRLSRDFNSEIAAACNAVAPSFARDSKAAEVEVASRYDQWKKTTRRRGILRRIGMAVPEESGLALRLFNPETSAFTRADWPQRWKALESRLEGIFAPGQGDFGRRGPRPGNGPGAQYMDEGTVFEQPIFASFGPPHSKQGPFGRREVAWVIFDINTDYLRDTLLPEELQRHLGTGGTLDYQVEVVNRFDPSVAIYRSDTAEKDITSSADGSVRLFDASWTSRLGGPMDRGRRPGSGPDRFPAPDSGRWELYVRHKAGSLQAVVAQTRRRNLALTGGVLLLMLATVAAWARFTRRAQRLAEIQMEFVAGISHELRTPLTVIHTAAYNLQGKLAHHPAQVERYGKLIQKESGRLKDIVEQVLQFASGKAGRVIQQREPVEIEEVIDQTIESSRTVVEAAHCVVERTVDAGLPPIEGDARALQLALENLVGNAAKYGTHGEGWIGIFASRTADKRRPMVEIRVADRGPGIPPDEQKDIFAPFFRGRRAVADQVHGTGLGLSLVKKIVEAHGGTVAVRSAESQGTEFIVRLPALEVPAEAPGAAQ